MSYHRRLMYAGNCIWLMNVHNRIEYFRISLMMIEYLILLQPFKMHRHVQFNDGYSLRGWLPESRFTEMDKPIFEIIIWMKCILSLNLLITDEWTTDSLTTHKQSLELGTIKLFIMKINNRSFDLQISATEINYSPYSYVPNRQSLPKEKHTFRSPLVENVKLTQKESSVTALIITRKGGTGTEAFLRGEITKRCIHDEVFFT